MNNLGYLFAAYTFIWVAVLAYVYFIARRQRALEKELQALREALPREPGQSE